MKVINKISRNFILSIIFLVILGVSFTPIAISLKTNVTNAKTEMSVFNGYILFTPEYSKETYMIDQSGEIVHSWSSNNIQAFGVYLLENGDLLRSDMPYINPTFMGGGVTGCVEKFNWNGEKIWQFTYSNENHCLHHDIEPLPNGNVLMIGWEYKTVGQAIQAGKRPESLPYNQLWPGHIIEVKQTGPSTGDIVWEWHVWDHLIQDYDPTKDNYGNVEAHPELIDINFGQMPILGDWTHINSIDYNEEFDQILLSSRGFSEIWVIDHSTTTEEAAGHSGGNSGKGGDILYRWGNPRAYRAGTQNDQKLFAQHDARWIKEGCPGEGNILVFNNGNGRPGEDFSSVDEIIPPVDSNGNYNLISGYAYEPEEATWKYTAESPYDFYAVHLSGAQRLDNGNTLICNGPIGRFFEVTPQKEILWQYDNPYPNPLQNDVFKIQYIPVDVPPEDEPDLNCEGSIKWLNVKAGDAVYDSISVENIGKTDSKLNWEIESYPEWGLWFFEPEFGKNLTPEDGKITIELSVVVPNQKNNVFDGSLRIVNKDNPADFEIIPVHITTPTKIFYQYSFSYQYIYQIFIKLFYFLN